jgi:hypothetical protein
MHILNMKHEKHPWFIRDSNPVPLGQKSGTLTTELPGHLLKSEVMYGKYFEKVRLCHSIFETRTLARTVIIFRNHRKTSKFTSEIFSHFHTKWATNLNQFDST